jgi:DNA-binding NarL/FixJ family response regulator
MTKKPLRVALVEDDTLTRESLVRAIARDPGLEIVGAYASAEEAEREVPAPPPDVLLVDIELPGRSGIDCTAALKAAHPDLHVLILTTYDNSALIFNALRAGANGYLLKRSRPAEIIRAIKEVASGGAPMSTHVARLVVAHFHRSPQSNNELESLTSREREVLENLARGLLYKEVAAELNLSPSTINFHVEAIYRKLHVRTRTEAVLKLRAH